MKRTILLTLFFALVLSVGVSAQDMNKDAALLYNDGNNLMKSGDYNGAIANYNKAINIDKDYRIYYQLGVALKKADKKAEAKAAFENSIKSNSNFDLGYNGLGAIEFAEGNYQDAIAHFEKAQSATANQKLKESINMSISRAYTQIGKESLSSGSPQKAVENLEKAISYDKYDAAYLFLSQAYVELGNNDKAIAAADNALNNRETISKGAPYYYKGLAFKNKGEKDKAIENFNAGKADSQYKKVCEYEIAALQ